MSKIKDLPKFLRPREKLFEKGPDALKDYELLAILLRTGYKGKSALEVAKRILDSTKLESLSKLSILELAKLKGVGKSRASTISASIELSERIFDVDKDITINSPDDIVKFVSYVRNKKKEYLIALYLDARSRLINSQEISMGTLTENIVHPREVFGPAIKCHAVQIALVHNHPSGSPEPSENDLIVTKRLIEAGKIIGIEVNEHIIITDKSYFSFKNKGLV
jgi:DNA repair protein RadC